MLYEVITIENYPSEILQEIVKVSDGSIREAVKVLDAVIDIEDDEEALQAVQNAVVSEVDTKELCQALIATSGKRWDTCKKILKGTTDDPERLRRAILGYLNAVLLSVITSYSIHYTKLYEVNSGELRDRLNFIYYMDFLATIPKWPWSFKTRRRFIF